MKGEKKTDQADVSNVDRMNLETPGRIATLPLLLPEFLFTPLLYAFPSVAFKLAIVGSYANLIKANPGLFLAGITLHHPLS